MCIKRLMVIEANDFNIEMELFWSGYVNKTEPMPTTEEQNKFKISFLSFNKFVWKLFNCWLDNEFANALRQ